MILVVNHLPEGLKDWVNNNVGYSIRRLGMRFEGLEDELHKLAS